MSSLLHLDPPTKQSELEVWWIMHLHSITNQLYDAFTDTKTVTKSHIPAGNVHARIEITKETWRPEDTPESRTRLKCGRPIGSKDKNPKKKKEVEKHDKPKIIETTLEETNRESDDKIEHETEGNPDISFNYIHNRKIWNRNKVYNIDDFFSYIVSKEIDEENNDREPKCVYECQKRHDCIKWKDAIKIEFESLNKKNVFRPIVLTPKIVWPIGYIWVFVRKQNEKYEIMRYKAHLVAQGFSQRSGIDYKETYFPVMDAIMFRFLMSLSANENLEMCLMDVVTAYLYGSLDTISIWEFPMDLRCQKY